MTVTDSAEEPVEIDDRLAEAMLSGLVPADLDGAGFDAVRIAIAELRAAGDVPVPQPSADLTALLDGVVVPLYRSTRSGRYAGSRRSGRPTAHRTTVWLFAAAASVFAAAVSVAAALQLLPDSAQRMVSNVIDDLTPFHVPATTHHSGQTPKQLPSQASFGISHQPTNSPAPQSSHSTSGLKVGAPTSVPVGAPTSTPVGPPSNRPAVTHTPSATKPSPKPSESTAPTSTSSSVPPPATSTSAHGHPRGGGAAPTVSGSTTSSVRGK